MESADGRRWPRHYPRVPLRVRIADQPEISEQITESTNISRGGVFFTCALPLKVGMPVDLVLYIPEEISRDSSREFHCPGRVVHVEPYSLPFGKSGIGIQFDTSESANIERLLSDRYPELQ